MPFLLLSREKCKECLHPLETPCIVIVFLGIGCLFYCLVEEKPCADEEEGCTEPWTFVDSLYFCTVTMSTVGYGDFSPTTPGGKAFTCFYIAVGISYVFAKVAHALEGAMQSLQGRILRLLDLFDSDSNVDAHKKNTIGGAAQGLSGRAVSLDDNADVKDFVLPPSALVYWVQSLCFWIVVLLLYQIVTAGIFTVLEDWSYGDAFYHCFVTATTVGYGDIAITNESTRLFSVFHIGVSVAWLAGFISHVDTCSVKRKGSLQRAALLVSELKWDTVENFDADHNGIDKVEFVIGMLMDLGVKLCGEPLKFNDVKPFLIIFDKYDKRLKEDGTTDGVLRKEDIEWLKRDDSTKYYNNQARDAAALREEDQVDVLEAMQVAGEAANDMFTATMQGKGAPLEATVAAALNTKKVAPAPELK